MPSKKIFDSSYAAILGHFLPADLDPLSQHTVSLKNLVNVALLALAVAPCFIGVYAWLGAWILAIPLSIATLFMIGAPCVYKWTRSLALAREQFITALFAFKVWETCVFGGIVSPGTYWFIAAPVAALLLGSIMSGIVWLLVSIGTLIVLQITLGDNVAFIASPVRAPYFLYTFSLVGLFISIGLFVLLTENARRKAFLGLEQANRTIRDLAIRDSLTGVYNRRFVWQEIEREEARAVRQQSSFCICLFDLDHFKQVNDTCGHTAGDRVLRAVADAIGAQVRDSDCFGRYGGEEFILLLKDTVLPGGMQFAERIRLHIRGMPLEAEPELAGITLSAGVAEYQPGESFRQTIDRADQALYVAKSAGRDRVMPAETGHDPAAHYPALPF